MSIIINNPTSENLNNGYEGANYQQDTLAGVTLFNAINALGLTGTELADPLSILELQWNGTAWKIVAA